MAIKELSGSVAGVGTAAGNLSSRIALSGAVSGKGTLGYGPQAPRVLMDVEGVLGETPYTDTEGVWSPTDALNIQDGDTTYWDEGANKFVVGIPPYGVPKGGTTAQVLTKLSDDDYDADWEDSTGSGGGGGSGSGWAGNGADAVPTTPDVADDEFDGVAVDTAGTRMTGATPWTAQNLGTSVVAVEKSCLVVAGQIAAGSHLRGYEQPTPAGNWKYRVRCALEVLNTSEWGAQLWLRNNANAKAISFGLARLVTTGFAIKVYSWTNVDTFSATLSTGTPINSTDSAAGLFVTFEVQYDGTNLIYRYSYNGVRFSTLFTQAVATFLGAAPTHIGIGAEVTNNTAIGPAAIFDYFRRAA